MEGVNIFSPFWVHLDTVLVCVVELSSHTVVPK